MTKYIKKFKELKKSDTNIAGGKGASLGEMTNAGINVPNGYVVLTLAFNDFLEKTKLKNKIEKIIKNEVDTENQESFNKVSEKIQNLILKEKIPENIKEKIINEFDILNTKFVAVRSSATAEDGLDNAWAGQLDSFLNITREDLNDAVKKCWASLFTSRAIFYRFEKGLDKTEVSVAVVIQKMVNSEKSGIAFSVHPVSQNRDEMIIEAGLGLGEAIVSGSVTPDSYVISKEKKEIIEEQVNEQTRALFRRKDGGNEWKELGEKGKEKFLSVNEALELGEIIQHIENHYNLPQDIEWAFEKGEFFITQSRPITTLGDREMGVNDKKYTIVASDFNSPLSRNEIWVNLIPFWKKWYNLPLPGVGIYSHEDRIDYFLNLKEWIEAKNKFQEKIKKNPLLLKEIIDLSETMGKEMNNYTKNLQDSNIDKWSNKKLIEFYKQYSYFQSRQYAIGVLLPLIDIQGESFLESYLKKFLNSRNVKGDEFKKIYKIFTTPTEKSFAMEQEIDLLILVDEINNKKYIKIFLEKTTKEIMKFIYENNLKFYNKLKKHANKYGWVYYVYAGPVFTIEYFIDFIKNIFNNKKKPKEELKRIGDEYHNLKKEKRYYINKLKPSVDEQILVNLVSRFIYSKPRRKDYQSKSYCHLEKFYLNLANKINVSLHEVRNYTEQQIINYLESGNKVKNINSQIEKHICLYDNNKTSIFFNQDVEQFLINNVSNEQVDIEETDLIIGSTAFNGKKTGIVKIVNSNKDINKINSGDVLVSIATSPSIITAMKKAVAIITDEGGLTCHAAIVSRELEIPCVIGTKIATQILKDGDLVEVDAGNGIVRILEKAEEKENKKQNIFYKKLSRETPIILSEIDSIIWDEIADLVLLDKEKIQPIKIFNTNTKLVDNYFRWDDSYVKKMNLYINRNKNRLIQEIQKHVKEYNDFFNQSNFKKFYNIKGFKKIYKIIKDYYFYSTFYLLGELIKNKEFKKISIKTRLDTEKFSQKRVKILIEIIENIIKQKEIVKFLTFNEIINFKNIQKKEIEKRINGYLFYNNKIILQNKIKIFLNNNNFILNDYKKEAKNKKQIKGKIANNGLTQGFIKIIYSQKDLDKIKNKDILVTPMTRPEYTQIIKKTSAIITDEGGVTSHAAIIARELKKPCIIGTKIATQVLNDGDFVEVDADNGVVRVLRKSKKSKGKYVLGNQDVDASLLNLEMTWSGIASDEVEKQLKIKPLKSFLEVINGKTINYYVESDRLRKYAFASAEKLIDDKKLLEFLENETIKKTEEMKSLAFEYIEKVESLSDKGMVVLLKEIRKLQSKATTLGSIVAFADIFGDVTNHLMDILKKYKKLKYDLSIYVHVLGTPEDGSLTEKAYEDIKNNHNYNELLKKYFWLDQGYIGRGLKKNDIKKIKSEEKKDEKYPEKEELMRELNLTKKELRYFKVSKSLIKIKTLRSDSRQFLHVLVNKIIDKISKERGIDSEILESLCADEVYEILNSNKKINKSNKRIKHSIIIPIKETLKNRYKIIATEDEIEKFLNDKVFKEDIVNDRELKGQIAEPGKIRGTVRLIFGPQHNNKIKKGEILISRATSPQLLPAMKKASAFITDIGGITSHAAIVARELKKPCIIGTKIATQVLNDGDFVEVDADNGVVKILEKANKTVEDGNEIDFLNKNLYIDWSADGMGLGHFAISILNKCYFNKMKEIMNVQYKNSFVIFSNDNISAYFDEDEVFQVSNKVKEKVSTLQLAKKWRNQYKKVTDKSIDILKKATVKDFYENTNKYIDMFAEYGVWQVLTKNLYNLLSSEKNKKNILFELESSRKYAEKFYRELYIFDKVYDFIHKKENKKGYTREMIQSILLEEFFEYKKTGILPDVNILMERYKKSGMLFFDNNKIKILDSEKIDKFLSEFKNKFLDKNKIKGDIANRGIVKGLVKVIKKFNNEDIKKGNILVTSMTDPNFVPIMKKAGAIITDGGGMLCHAAIVARELNKPCIIGTKIATQVLKDGDLVKVDADKGIIDIITKFNVKTKEVNKINIKTVSEYLNKNIFDIQSARSFYSFIGHALEVYSKRAEEVSGFNYPQILYFKGNHFWQVVDEKDLKKVAKGIFNKYTKNNNIFEEYKKKTKKIGEKINSIYKINDINNKNLKIIVRDLFKISEDLIVYLVIGEDKGQIIESELKRELINSYKIKENEVNELISILIYGDKKTIFSRERLDFLSLCSIYDRKGEVKIFKKEVEEYITKFFYKNTDFINRIDVTYNTILFEIKEAISNKSIKALEKEYELILKNHSDTMGKKSELINTYSFNKNILNKINYLTELTSWVNNERKEIMIKYYAYPMLFLIEKIASIKCLEIEDLFKYSKNEIFELLENNRYLSTSELENRKSGVIKIYNERFNNFYCENSEKASKMFSLARHNIESYINFSGSVASKGNIKNGVMEGIVRVVLNPKGKNMKFNEILVTSMTRPDFIHLMSNSLAIITDEGGISSHAAIVAREMKKPCIIGTKIATQVLKDGDLVEVDVNNGVIRILEKNKNKNKQIELTP